MSSGFSLKYFCSSLGKRFIWRTIVGTLLLSLWLYILPLVDLTDGDYVLAAIFGGCIGGVGMGLVLLAKSTTGGTEMVATLIQLLIICQHLHQRLLLSVEQHYLEV